jgi:hypothetical protein
MLQIVVKVECYQGCQRAGQALKVADHHLLKCFGFRVYNALWHLLSITYINHMSYSSGKIGSSSKPFDIYKGPDSDLEMMKPRAIKADLLSTRTKRANLSTRIKTKAHSKRGPPQVGEGVKSEYKARLKRKLKQFKLKNKLKGRELIKLKRSARLEAKRQKTS